MSAATAGNDNARPAEDKEWRAYLRGRRAGLCRLACEDWQSTAFKRGHGDGRRWLTRLPCECSPLASEPAGGWVAVNLWADRPWEEQAARVVVEAAAGRLKAPRQIGDVIVGPGMAELARARRDAGQASIAGTRGQDTLSGACRILADGDEGTW